VSDTERPRVGADNAGIDDPRSRLRRRDRGRDDPWVRSFVEAAPYGFLATVDDGQPFLNSNLFVYDGDRHCIYLHTHRRGRTRENLAEPEKVAFGIAGMGRLLPAPEALEFSVEYAGVTAFGTGRIVDDDDEARKALQMLLDKYAPHLRPGRDYRTTSSRRPPSTGSTSRRGAGSRRRRRSTSPAPSISPSCRSPSRNGPREPEGSKPRALRPPGEPRWCRAGGCWILPHGSGGSWRSRLH